MMDKPRLESSQNRHVFIGRQVVLRFLRIERAERFFNQLASKFAQCQYAGACREHKEFALINRLSPHPIIDIGINID
jgi:hypothetical protein